MLFICYCLIFKGTEEEGKDKFYPVNNGNCKNADFVHLSLIPGPNHMKQKLAKKFMHPVCIYEQRTGNSFINVSKSENKYH